MYFPNLNLGLSLDWILVPIFVSQRSPGEEALLHQFLLITLFCSLLELFLFQIFLSVRLESSESFLQCLHFSIFGCNPFQQVFPFDLFLFELPASFLEVNAKVIKMSWEVLGVVLKCLKEACKASTLCLYSRVDKLKQFTHRKLSDLFEQIIEIPPILFSESLSRDFDAGRELSRLIYKIGSVVVELLIEFRNQIFSHQRIKSNE